MSKLPIVFRRKKAIISPFNFERTWKKKKLNLCQNKVLSSNFSFGLVECSYVELTEKVSEKKTDKFLLNVRKRWEKNIFDRKNFCHKTLQWTGRKQFWRHRREVFVEMPEKNFAQVSMMSKKGPIRKKVSPTDLLDKW